MGVMYQKPKPLMGEVKLGAYLRTGSIDVERNQVLIKAAEREDKTSKA